VEIFTSLWRLPGQSDHYQLYLLVRPKFHKDSPWRIIERLAPRSPLELCLLNPMFLDYHISDEGGYNSCLGP